MGVSSSTAKPHLLGHCLNGITARLSQHARCRHHARWCALGCPCDLRGMHVRRVVAKASRSLSPCWSPWAAGTAFKSLGWCDARTDGTVAAFDFLHSFVFGADSTHMCLMSVATDYLPNTLLLFALVLELAVPCCHAICNGNTCTHRTSVCAVCSPVVVTVVQLSSHLGVAIRRFSPMPFNRPNGSRGWADSVLVS